MKLNLERFGEIELIHYFDLAKNAKLTLLEMRNHPNVKAWAHTKNDITQEEHLNFIKSTQAKDSDKIYKLVKKDKEIIGAISFVNIDSIKRECNVGFFSNQFNSNPMAAFILESALIKYSFEILQLDKIHAEVYANNTNVIKLHKMFGFNLLSKQGDIKKFALKNKRQ